MSNAQVEDLANTLMKASLFGRNVDIQFETAETERQEKGRKMKLEKKRREEEIRKEEEERRKQELDDLRFAKEEQDRIDREFQQQNSPQRFNTGRGRILFIRDQQSHESNPMRGRGRNYQKAGFFEVEKSVKRQIHQLSDGMYQNNHFQKQVWLGDAPTTSICARDNVSPLYGEAFPEQFEDTCSSSRSSAFNSPHSESASFFSFSSPNSSDSSPIPTTNQAVPATATPSPTIEQKEKPQIAPKVSRGAIRKTRSRIAAKFDFDGEDEIPKEVKVDEKENTSDDILKPISNGNTEPQKLQKYDPVAILTSHDRRSAPTRIRMGPETISINELRSSQRILSKGLLRPEELLPNPYRQSLTRPTDFNYNKNDFPAL